MSSTSTMQSRESDSDTIPFCPVLHPTMKEFSDFNVYIEKLEKEYSQNYGIVKIVPPKGWKARQADYEESLDHKMITGPIEQNPYGKGGVYECVHITKKSIPFREYKKKAKAFDKITDNKSIEKVEDLFWKNISFSPPLYGSDMEMSLFDEGVKWNLNDLHSILNDGLSSRIAGVNTPYLYIGSWKTLFAWHKEDLDLGAINYLHYGKPKFWYSIARSDSHKLEAIAQNYFAESFAKCPEFLRHKTSVINPYQIIKKLKGDIKISKIAQEAGEFMVVFGGAYHHGFNWGYNIAEAVNYASLGWLDLFPGQRLCKCASDNVSIDHNEFLTTLLKTRPEFKDKTEVKNFSSWLKQKQLEEQEQISTEEEEEQDSNKDVAEMKKKSSQQEKKKRGRKSKKIIESNEDQNNNKAEVSESTIEPKRLGKKILKENKTKAKQAVKKGSTSTIVKKCVQNSASKVQQQQQQNWQLQSPKTPQICQQQLHSPDGCSQSTRSSCRSSRKNSLNMETERIEQETD